LPITANLSALLTIFRDDISNGSEVIVLTDKQTDTQTYTTENYTTLAARGMYVGRSRIG